MLSEEPLRAASALLPLIMGGPLYFVMTLLLLRGNVSRQIQKYLREGENKGVIGPQKVILSGEGVADVGQWSQTMTSWKAVERVLATPECLYIYVNAMAAVLVPRRFFDSDATFTHFVEAARVYQAHVKGEEGEH